MGEIETQIFHNLGALIMGYLLAVFMEYFDLFWAQAFYCSGEENVYTEMDLTKYFCASFTVMYIKVEKWPNLMAWRYVYINGL